MSPDRDLLPRPPFRTDWPMNRRYVFTVLIIAFFVGVGILLLRTLYEEVKQDAIRGVYRTQWVHAEQAALGIEGYISNWLKVLTSISLSPDVILLDQPRKDVRPVL